MQYVHSNGFITPTKEFCLFLMFQIRIKKSTLEGTLKKTMFNSCNDEIACVNMDQPLIGHYIHANDNHYMLRNMNALNRMFYCKFVHENAISMQLGLVLLFAKRLPVHATFRAIAHPYCMRVFLCVIVDIICETSDEMFNYLVTAQNSGDAVFNAMYLALHR